jgi:hypothetical protein
MSGILYSVARIGHQLWGTLSKKKFFSPRLAAPNGRGTRSGVGAASRS